MLIGAYIHPLIITMNVSGGYGEMERSNSVSGEGHTFLHGYLIIHVNEARYDSLGYMYLLINFKSRNIPDMENWYSKIVNSKDVSDPFVDVKLGKCRIAKTRVIDNSLNPQWRESFKVEVCHKADSLIFDVRDKDHAYTEVIGIVDVPCHDLINGQVIEGWRPITKGSKVYFNHFSLFNFSKLWKKSHLFNCLH